MVASAVEDAAIGNCRIIMIPSLNEDSVAGNPYATTLALSGSGIGENPAGSAKEMETSGREMFGGGQAAKTHELPVRPTAVPSGHTSASSGQVIGRNGCSTAFRYNRPPTPIRIINAMPRNRLFICG